MGKFIIMRIKNELQCVKGPRETRPRKLIKNRGEMTGEETTKVNRWTVLLLG